MMRRARAAPAWLLLGLLACAERQGVPADATRSWGSGSDRAPEPSALSAMLGVPLDSLRAAGEERYARQAYDSARQIWGAELVRARAAGDSAGEARVLMWLGLAAWRLGVYEDAWQDGEASLQLKRRLGLDAELSRSFNALGLLAWNQGRHRLALQHFDSAVQSAQRHGDTAGLIRAGANIPLVRVELGDFDAARRGLLSVRAAARQAGDPRVEGNVLANLAMLEIRLGDPAAALPLLADARRLYRSIEYGTGEANALGQLATAFAALGDLQPAIATADSGLQLAMARGLQQEMASTTAVLADLHVQAGNLRLALRRLQEADRLASQLGLSVERGTHLRRASAILLALGEPRAAVEYAMRALEVHRGVDARNEIVHDRLQLAVSHARTGAAESARAQVDSALRAVARLGNPVTQREAAIVAAKLALDLGDPRTALRYAARSGSRQSLTEWRLADVKSEAMMKMGRLEEARREGERAVAAIERERSSLGLGPLRSVFLFSRLAPYSRLVAIHLRRGDTAAAFETAASLPGRSVAERHEAYPGTGDAPPAGANGGALLNRIAALERELGSLDHGAGVTERRHSLVRAIDAAQAAYEEHLARRAVSPIPAGTRPGTIRTPELQSRLQPDEVLVTFLAGETRLDIFAVHRGGVVHRSVSIGERQLAARVRLVRELVGSGAPAAGLARPLGALFELLIRPILDDPGVRDARRVVIVPHRTLGAVPFAALRDSASGRYLVQGKIIAYAPTVTALRSGPARRSVAEAGLAVFAPLPDLLPGTEEEAGAVAKLLPNVSLHVGGAATEAAVRAALAQGTAIHVASHGAQNEQNPLFSRIAVAGEAPRAAPGWLEVHEVLGIRINSPLVFLSGCETALGANVTQPLLTTSEEGSLAHAFLAAGAGSVVATLWRVSDAASVPVVTAFYRHLRVGASPDLSLALAQREAIQSGAPLTWAAYTVNMSRSNSVRGIRTTGDDP